MIWSLNSCYFKREFDIICFLLTHRPAGTYIFVARSPVIAKALGSGEALYEDIAQITLATIREVSICGAYYICTTNLYVTYCICLYLVH